MIRYLKPGERVPETPPKRYLNYHGYIRLRWRVGPKQYVETLEHRVFDGVVTTARHVHHHNGDPTDNRRENLEPLTPGQHGIAHRRGPDPQKVLEMYLSGVSGIKVAQLLGCHRTYVYSTLAREGVPTRPPGGQRKWPVDEGVLRALHAQGVRAAAMARILGVPRDAIRREMRSVGLPTFPVGGVPGWSPSQVRPGNPIV